jgi:hypothetical protein
MNFFDAQLGTTLWKACIEENRDLKVNKNFLAFAIQKERPNLETKQLRKARIK